MFGEKPVAYARMKGNKSHPNITGRLYLFPAQGGSLVWVEVQEVTDKDQKPSQGFHGFHIHEGSDCTGTETDPFANAGTHYSPTNQEHPSHTGDLPPLLLSNGYGWMQFYTGRFRPEDVIGHTVVIHDMADDFHSQPAGDSGTKIACGEITALPAGM
ncbi:MAG: superoxide dismutase family protein [Lachnospiraceae bacterium]|nr:superoxide dismutase family protein [Lachnospiraceae bacterium]